MGTQDTIILTELYKAADTFDDWKALNIGHAPAIHIAVMSEPFLSYVFESKKTVESRFSLHKIAPYQTVQPGDIVLMKAGPIMGSFTVQWARYFDLAECDIKHIISTYGEAICGNEAFWKLKASSRYASLLGIGEVQKLSSLNISKFDRRAWISLAK